MADQTPLTNADFRKLLATPRPNRDGDTKPAATPSRGGGGDKAKKPYKPKPKPTNKADEEEDEHKYRDRAEERRRGVNPDYAAANQLLGVIGANGDVDPTKLSVEDSKYLGGDLDHTHLVKGLDYALLQKMREAAEKHKEQEEEEKEKEAVDTAAPKTAHTVLTSAKAAHKKEEIVINHPVARGVYNALFNPPRSAVHEQFLPRRMAFVYEFEADEYGVVPDIPTTLRRSKADCPKPVEAVFARVDNAVIERIAKIMSYIKTGAGGKRIKKKDRDELLGELKIGLAAAGAQQAAGGQQGGGSGAHAAAGATAGGPGSAAAGARKPAAAAAAEDDDIFGDAGTDYKPAIKKKEAKGQQAEDMELEEGEAPPGPAPPPAGMDAAQAAALAYGAYPDTYGQYGDAYGAGQYGAGQYGVDPYGGQYAGVWPDAGAAAAAYGAQGAQQQAAAVDEPKWRVRPKKAEERMVDFVDDAYGEYYPMAAPLEAPTIEEDDEEGVKGKAARLAAAKADGPAGRSDKETAREGAQKINTQLQKIEHILKEKGHDHAGAFGRTPSRRAATGEDPNLVRANEGRKRPRI